MKPDGHSAPCWELIDGIVLINLDRNPERWERFCTGCGRHLPADRLHRLSAVEGVRLPGYGEAPWFTGATGERARFWGGTAGCALSHRRAIEMAKARGWHRILVLEDDAAMGEMSEAYSRVLSQALEQLQGGYMLYLGYNRPRPYGRRLSGEGGVSLWRIEGVLATHAYLVTSELYDTLLDCLPRENNVWEWLSRYRAVDVFYRDFLTNGQGVPTYSVEPQLFQQGDFESSISTAASPSGDFRTHGEPLSLDSATGLLHRLASPLRRLKTKLNSLRTHRRASRGGLPGYRKRRSAEG